MLRTWGWLTRPSGSVRPRPRQSYLSIERVLEAARTTGAEAIHPGYGFLSENAAFVRACADAGITFIGPPAEAMELLGDKVRAKLAARAADVPVLDGLHRPGLDRRGDHRLRRE